MNKIHYTNKNKKVLNISNLICFNLFYSCNESKKWQTFAQTWSHTHIQMQHTSSRMQIVASELES